jgi:hypothetical protein
MADATTFPTQWGVPSGGGVGSLPPQGTLSSTLNAPINPSMLKPSAPPPVAVPPTPAPAPAPQPAANPPPAMMPPPARQPPISQAKVQDDPLIKEALRNFADERAAIKASGEAQIKAANLTAQGNADVAQQQADSERKLGDKQLAIMQQEAASDAPFVPTKDTLPQMGLMFALIGMIGSALGGKGTTMSALGAQEAMSGMLKGWQDGDAEEYQKQKDAYEANVKRLDRSVARAKEAYDIYQKEAASNISAAKANWDVKIAEANAPNLKATMDLKQAEVVEKQIEFLTKAQQHKEDLQKKMSDAAQKAQQDQLTAQGQQFLADYFASTGNFPNMGMGGAGARIGTINTLAAQGASGAATASQAANFATGKQSLALLTKQYDVASANEKVMVKNMAVAQNISPEAQKSVMPWLNKWEQTGSTQLGGKDVPPYATAIVTIADAYAKILSGNTGAAGATEGYRQQAASVINQALNTGQIAAVFNIIKQDAANKISGYGSQIAERKSAMVPGQKQGASAPTLSNW